MEQNNFILDLIARLLGKESQEQVKKDIDSFLSNIKVPLIGTLSPKTQSQLKKDLSSMDGEVNLSGKVDSKSVATSLQQATAQAQKQANMKPVEVGVDFAVKKDKLVNDIKLLSQQNSKLFKDTDMSIKYNSLLDDASMAKNTVQLSSLRNQLAAFKSELKVTGNMGLTLGDSLKKSLSKVMGLLGNFNVIMQLNQQLHNAWTEAQQLDKSMTDLSRVNVEITRSGFPNYLDRVIDKTKQLAVATKDYIDSVTTFSRAGYNLADSETLADAAIQLEKVGDMSAVDASKALLAGLQGYAEIDGYGMDQLTEKAQALNDKIDLIGNTASISQKEVAQGIQAVGSVMSDANTSVDEFIALLGAGNRAVQDSDKVALAIRTSALRIRGCTAELQEMGEETDSVVESTSKLAEKIEGLTNINGSGGVKILEEDEETFRSIYDIYNDISKVYDKMSDKDASALLDLIAGKNRSNQISAILQNMSEANELLERSLNATGTASEEYQIYLDSAEAATERFGVAVTETYSNIISGDTVKGLANASAAVLDFANSLGLVEGTLKGGLAIGAMKGITTFTVALKNSMLQASNYGAALEAVNKLGNFAEGADEYADEIKKLKTSCSVLTDTQLKQVLAHKNLSDVQLIEILQLDKLEDAQQQARLTQLGLTQATEAQTEASMANLSITNMLRVAWTKFTAVVKANPLAIGITAIVTATYAAMKASEAWTNRLRDQAQESSNAYKGTLEEIESINSELQSNGQRIDELNAKENLTLIESEELERLKESNRELENTLALKEKIAQQEKANANKDAVKYFEEDTNKYNKETGTYNSTHIEVATQYLDEVYAKEQRIHEIELEMSRTDTKTEKYRELSGELDITQKSYDDLLQRVQDYNDVFTDLDDYLFEGQDDALIQQLEEFYKYMNEVLYGVAETNTNAIRDILAKADFKDASKQLEKLGKSGELSVETLSSRFPELIKYMDEAGISAQELYQYIMALSDPDAVNYAEIERQFKQSAGIRDGEINGASDQKIWDEIKSSFDDDEWQIALEAYVKVRDQYGEHPEGWTVKDWVTNIQNELETELLEVETQLSISQTVDQLNTQIKPAFDSLQSAWQEIFTDDGFALNSIDILSTCDSIKSKLDEMSEVGLEVDYSAFEDLVTVLNNTESTEQDVENAFDSLATSITNAGLSGTEDFETMKAALEDLGVVNNEMVAFDNLISKTNALADAGIDLANATEAEMQAFVNESVSAENAGEALALLHLKKALVNQETITTAADCQNILELAQAANVGIAYLNQLNTLMNLITQRDSAHASGDSRAVSELNRAIKDFSANIVDNLKLDDVKVDFTPIGSGAKSAGKSAGKDYKDGLKEELNDLNSVISGITGRIDDQISTIRSQKEAALESIDAQIDALNEQKSALEAQKKALEDARDAAVEALEEERDARIEVIEQQQKQLELAIKSIDKQIKQKEKVIKSINDEIKAMQDANAEKRRQIDLQKAMYELERLQHQRTILQYSEGMGMHYVTDSKNIRDQKDKVDDAKLEIEIANKQKQIDLIEKEIDLLNEKKDAINEQIDLLDEQIEKINEYYDKEIEKVEKFYDEQIKAIDAQIESIDKQIEALQKQREQTEKYYESLIENLEKSKSKYEELTELVGRAELSAALQKLGIDEEALLNGSEEEFQKLKAAYMDVVFKLNEGNDEVLSALQELSGYNGTAPAMLEDSNGKLDEMNGKLDTSNQNVGNVNSSLGDTATKTSDVATNVSTLNDNLSQVTTTITSEQTAFDTLRQKIDEVITAINEKITATQMGQATTAIATTTEMACYMLLKEKILEVKESLDAISNTVTTLDATPVNNLTTAFQLLYNQLLLVSTTLGAGMEGAEEGAVGGIASAIQALNEISLEDGIIAQFTNLKIAVDEVTAAIGGGGGGDSESSSGGEGSGGSGGGSKGGSSGKSGGGDSEGEGGGGGSLTDAITQMSDTAIEKIGEPDAEGDGTVIGEFGALETAVNDVTAAIGSGESEGGEGSGEGEDGNLIGSIIDLGDTTEEELGESGGDGIIGRFEEFRDVIEDAAKQVASISDGLDEIDGKEVECTITINIKVNGDIPAFASGTVLGNMQIESASYNAKFGKAFASGTIGLPKAEKNALVSEYGQTEMTVLPNGKTIVTDTPTMMNLPKDTVIYNEEQTKKILSNKIDPSGTAHANGTVDDEGWFTAADGTKLRPHRPGDRSYDLCQKIDAYLKSIDNNLDILTVNANARYEKDMTELEKHVTNNVNNVTNNRNVQPVINQNVTINCPNVTNDSGVENIQKQLGNLSLRAYQEPLRDY